MATSCIVCGDEKPKYRCPSCANRYCSVACCKEHKKVSCLDQSKKDDGRQKEVEDEGDKRDESEAESALIGLDTLKPSQMKKLSTNPYVRRMICSKRLRHIRSVDSATDRPEALKRLRKNNKSFHEFVGKMLDVIQGQSDDEKGDSV